MLELTSVISALYITIKKYDVYTYFFILTSVQTHIFGLNYSTIVSLNFQNPPIQTLDIVVGDLILLELSGSLPLPLYPTLRVFPRLRVIALLRYFVARRVPDICQTAVSRIIAYASIH